MCVVKEKGRENVARGSLAFFFFFFTHLESHRCFRPCPWRGCRSRRPCAVAWEGPATAAVAAAGGGAGEEDKTAAAAAAAGREEGEGSLAAAAAEAAEPCKKKINRRFDVEENRSVRNESIKETGALHVTQVWSAERQERKLCVAKKS